MEINRKGCTRIVILTRKYAFKIPNIGDYKMFLYGLIANMQEATFAKSGWSELCPILLSLPLGILTVMRRAREMTVEEFMQFDAEAFTVKPDYIVPVELKADSFGWLDGKIVAIDYGN